MPELTVTASASATSGAAPLSVSFSASASGGSGTFSSWLWDFGDGGSSTSQNPSYSYADIGVFTATVTVTDSDGNDGSDDLNITVQNTTPDVGLFSSGDGPQFNSDGSLAPFTTAEVTAMGIKNYAVREGYPQHTREVASSTIRRQYLINFANFESFIAYMVGFATISSTGSLSRLLPFSPPGLPEFGATKILSAKGYAGPGIDDSTATPAYPSWLIEVLFEHLPYDLLPDNSQAIVSFGEYKRFVQRMPSKTETKYLTLTAGNMWYLTPDGSGPNQVNIPFSTGLPQQTVTISYKWHRVPEAGWGPGSPLYQRVHGSPDGTTPGLIGTVNSTELQVCQAWPGQAKFIGVDEGEGLLRDPTGKGYYWNLLLQWELVYRVGGHNALWFSDTNPSSTRGPAGYFLATRQSNSTWYAPGQNPPGICLFDAYDHNQLWNVG
jgi:PKD repeat protein